jgi:type IV pilus assembly protein PilB
VVKLVNLILLDAIRKNASDIHVEPYEKSMRIRYRIDGLLYEVMKPPIKLKNAIISRVKIMSNLDIAERRLPQDGRIKMKLGRGKEMDFRVSVLPVLWGEKVVLRLLDKSNLQLDMTKLGFDAEGAGRVQGQHRQALRDDLDHGPDRARARRPRCTRRSLSSTRPTRTSPPRKIPSSSTSTASTRCRCTKTSA